jgi:hypothetical protein
MSSKKMNMFDIVRTNSLQTNLQPKLRIGFNRRFNWYIRESTNGVYVIDEHESNGCAGSVLYVEHVEVVMTFHATYRGSLQVGTFYSRPDN